MPKRVRVALIGSGTVSDPYRANLPTYTIVAVDYGALTAIVDVPDSAWPLADTEFPTATVTDAKAGDVITGFTALQKVKAAVKFDKVYTEHAGKFTLDVK